VRQGAFVTDHILKLRTLESAGLDAFKDAHSPHGGKL
jgi:hypothetical protein